MNVFLNFKGAENRSCASWEVDVSKKKKKGEWAIEKQTKDFYLFFNVQEA